MVDGIKGYDNDLLVNIADLEVGRTYAVPGDDISRAVQNYGSKVFSQRESGG